MEVQTLRTNVMINSRRTGLITAVCLGTTFDLRPNYIPLQYPYHGPNLFSFDSNGHYEIDFDNNGLEDLALQIRLQNTACHLALRTGRDASKKTHTVPVPAVRPISAEHITTPRIDQTPAIRLKTGRHDFTFKA